MKKLTSLFALLACFFLSSCYDDTAIWDSVRDHESRIEHLENLCEKINSDLVSLQTIVTALEKNEYISNVAPITVNGKDTGYVITFISGKSITIQHGVNGVDGTTPTIGIKVYEGVYYWTLDGNWMLDGDGNKIPSTGEDGTDGVTPKLMIEDGYWHVSYDNGNSWTKLGRASEENNFSTVFKDIYQEDGHLCFVLSDDSVLKVKIQAKDTLDITFDIEQGTAIVPNATYKIGYTITGGDENTCVRLIRTKGYIDAKVKPETSTKGNIFLYLDDIPYSDNETDYDIYNSTLTMLVSVSDGKNNSILKALNFTKGIIDAVQDASLAEPTAGKLTVQVETNADYDIIIPESTDWLTYCPDTKAALRTDELVFALTENSTGAFRTSSVYLVNSLGEELESFLIVQRSEIAGYEIPFADEEVRLACVNAFDSNLDGILTYEEAALVKDISLLKMPENAQSFDELKHFVAISSIPAHMFDGCWLLESITLPEQITTIEAAAFASCWSLKSITIPSGVTSLDGTRMFENCGSLSSVTLPQMESIGSYMFMNCISLKEFKISETIRYINQSAFQGSGLEGVMQIPASVESISKNAFDCPNLTEVHMISETPCEYYNGFSDNIVVYVPDGCYQAYKEAWTPCNWAVKNIAFCHLGTYEYIDMTDGGEGWYIADVTFDSKNADDGFNFVIDHNGENASFKSYYPVNSDPIKNGIEYPLSANGGYHLSVPYGSYRVYLATDFTKFKFSSTSIYHNDFDGETATKTYGSSSNSYPNLDQFDGWQNAAGTGAADVTYAYNGMSARSNSNSDASYSDYAGSGMNNLFFGKSAYFATNNIALSDATDLTLTFGTEKYSADNGSVFTNSEFHIWLSNDGGAKWVEFTDYTFAGGTTAGRWNVATANFTVPAGTETLSICMKVDVASSYRLDDMLLTSNTSGQTGSPIDFSKGKEIDFNESGTSSPEKPSDLKTVTIAEFLNAPESNEVWYKITGVVTSIANETYGNFYISDETGEVYIYGLTNGWIGYNDQSFSQIGISVGDTITIGTLRGSYKNVAQGGGSTFPAYFISR